MYDSTGAKYPEQSIHNRREVGWQLPGTQGTGEWPRGQGVQLNTGVLFSWGRRKNVPETDGGGGRTTMSGSFARVNSTRNNDCYGLNSLCLPKFTAKPNPHRDSKKTWGSVRSD